MGSRGEEAVKEKYDRVCGELNLDQESMEAAWASYETINNDYVLEGDHIEWLGCALYVAGQNSMLETVEGGTSSGNKVSLTQILRATKLNLIEFFKKIKKWLEMINLPNSFHKKVEALERKFEVASIIFDKYRKVFCDLFQLPAEKQVPAVRQRGRKASKNRPCTPFEVFRFGWTLYIHIKGQYPQINDDLVNSHHLMLCCMDMLYCSALVGKHRDLLHPDCPFLPEDPASVGSPPSETPCVLSELCTKYNAIEKECFVIREYYWRTLVKKMFEAEVLSGKPRAALNIDEALAHLFSPGSFYTNEKSLNREYELNMLTEGDFDERVFLHHNASEEIGTPTRQPMGAYQLMTPPRHVQYGTPLMGREYLGNKDNKLTPASEATHSVAQLHLLLDNCPDQPSDYLKTLCSSCMSDPLPEIERQVQALRERFLQDAPPKEGPSQFAKMRLRLSVSLYYKLLAVIIHDEEIKNPDFGQLQEERALSFLCASVRDETSCDLQCLISLLQTMLEYEPLHKSLFALCMEIILFSYNSQSRAFPWVLEVFAVSAYHFYRLIEVVIKAEGRFPRSIIKHLNRVEEMVLGHLAWKSDSPLFDAIDAAGSVPSYEDVALPTPPPGSQVSSHLLHPRLKSLGGKGDSPLSSLLSRGGERMGSPNSSARRQLFSPGGSQKRSPTKPIPIAPKPPQRGVTIKLLNTMLLQAGATSVGQQAPTTQATLSPSRQPPQESLASNSTQLVAPSTASTGTQTSPRTTNKGINIANVGELMYGGAMPMSPGNLTVGSLLSPPRLTSPSIPTVVVPSPAKTPQKGSLSAMPIATTPVATPPRPRRGGSLALFYRKVYPLAFIRIKDLCDRLGFERDAMQKVWTCFEHCMVRTPDLMRDRHLDQIIMCCIYVMSKVLRLDVTFQEIMRQYRHQPQAKSHVYRSVLLNSGPRKPPQPDSNCPTLGESHEGGLEESSVFQGKETPVDHILYRADIPVGDRGDIIQFYNKLFIGFIKDYVLRFSPNESEIATPSLSPLPVIRKTTPSPRQLSRHHQIFVSPHKGSSIHLSPLAKTYIVQKSPASKLQDINHHMKAEAAKAGIKRSIELLASPQPTSPAKRPHIQVTKSQARKPHSLMQQLMSVANDRASAKSQSAPPTSECD